MDAPHRHGVHVDRGHLGWNREIPPAVSIVPGTEVAFAPQDASGGQIRADSSVADIGAMDFGRVNPVIGPVRVDGAQPGDALKVTLLSVVPAGWGWTANIPGFGLLADDFPHPALHVWRYDAAGRAPAMYGPGGRVPLKPFCGTIGLAPAQPGQHSVVPPRRVGGNMDIRDLAVGADLYLPVEVEGALLSLGDPHAAQGDGEICGTAIECPADVLVRIDLVKDARLDFPRFTTPGPVTRHLDVKGYEVTTGIGPDLMSGAQHAVRGMIDLLGRRHGMSAIDAYLLLSVCADLRVSEIVDQPNWVVSCYFPRVVLE